MHDFLFCYFFINYEIRSLSQRMRNNMKNQNLEHVIWEFVSYGLSKLLLFPDNKHCLYTIFPLFYKKNSNTNLLIVFLLPFFHWKWFFLHIYFSFFHWKWLIFTVFFSVIIWIFRASYLFTKKVTICSYFINLDLYMFYILWFLFSNFLLFYIYCFVYEEIILILHCSWM